MTVTHLSEEGTAQRALEALRNGVPNGDAVNALGCMQPEALDRFNHQLEALARQDLTVPSPAFSPVPGTLIAGDFGAGKSHTLAFFEQEALRRGFVVSKVVVSKETPLHDPSKLFAAAVREARLPDSRGSLMHELAIRLDYRKDTAIPFVDWATRVQPYGMLGASVLIHERSHDAELQEQIINWWSGDKLAVKVVRDGLKDLGSPKAFEVRAVRLADLAPVRFEFASRLAQAVGFAGWVLLLDEVELVGRYSLLQRAKAYAELARWLGLVPGQAIPGITAVAAITDDFEISVLDGRHDREKAPERLAQKGDSVSLAQATMAEAAIEAISRHPVRLHRPSDDSLQLSHDRLRDLYQTAYGVAPRTHGSLIDGAHRPMRNHVRRWINEWDLDRLYPDEAQDSLEEELHVDYTEDRDLQSESEEGAGSGDEW